MPHGTIDQQNNAPTWTVEASTGKSGVQQYGNTVFGVDVVEAQVTQGPASPGWVRAVRGQGGLESVTIATAGTGYANTDTIKVVAASGANAAGTIGTDGSGVITSVTLSNKGGLFFGSETVAITTSGGTGASLTPTFTGRAGRVQYETIVATKNITGDGSDDTLFPDS